MQAKMKKILSLSFLLVLLSLSLIGCGKDKGPQISLSPVDSYPIEHLVFMTNPDKVNEWIELDHEYWTKYLSTNSGFLRKEVWINEENPGEVHTLIWWKTMEEWKMFSEDDVIANDKKFTAALNGIKSEYTDLADVDQNQQLYKVKSTVKEGDKLIEKAHDKEPIEHLVFMTDPDKVNEWIELDHKYWTQYLNTSGGLLKKEVWINEDNPGEIHTIIWWKNMDLWKSFSEEDVINNDKKFTKALDGIKSEYTDLNSIEHGQLFQVQETVTK